MGQYYVAVFLGDAPNNPATQKQIKQLEKLLELKEAALNMGITLGMETAETKEAQFAPLRAKLEQLKAMSKGGEFIRAWLSPRSCGHGSKLLEHASVFSDVVKAAMFYLSPEGPFYKTRLVWAGDYADEEPDEYEPRSRDYTRNTLFSRANDQPKKCMPPQETFDDDYHYFVNHSKREAVDMRMFHRYQPHPIPLLTAEGNGRSGGDYSGQGDEFVGIWARDVVSVEKELPEGFQLRGDITFEEA